MARKAGIKILGHVCDSDALLDCIRDDIDEWVDIITKTMVDPDGRVREAACLVTGLFSESVVPDFLEAHEKVMPVLVQLLEGQVAAATQSEDQADSTERAIYALAEFTASMEVYEVRPYLNKLVEICMTFLNG